MKLRRLSKDTPLVFFIISINDVVILSKQTRFVYSLMPVYVNHAIFVEAQ